MILEGKRLCFAGLGLRSGQEVRRGGEVACYSRNTSGCQSFQRRALSTANVLTLTVMIGRVSRLHDMVRGIHCGGVIIYYLIVQTK